jgi:hypothetical protein
MLGAGHWKTAAEVSTVGKKNWSERREVINR